MNSFKVAILLSITTTLFACGGGASENTTLAPAEVPPSAPEPVAQETSWVFSKQKTLLTTHSGPRTASFIYDFYATDLNNDGKDEIIVGGPVWDNTVEGVGFVNRVADVEVLVSNDSGYTNDPSVMFAFGQEPQLVHLMDIIVSDFDRDGVDDYVFSGTGLDIFDTGVGDRMQYYIGSDQGQVTVANNRLNFDMPGFFHTASAGDYDGDGSKDLSMWQCCLLPNIELESPANMLINDGAGEFEYSTRLLPSELTVNHSWSTNEMLSADLNNSTCDDIVAIGTTTSHDDFIMWNYCDGPLSDTGIGYEGIAPTSYAIPKIDGYTLGTAVATIDYNQDDNLDLVIARADSYQTNNTHVQILRNNGDQTFTDVTSETIGTFNNHKWIAHIHVEDIDQDGFEDMVFTVDNPFQDEQVDSMVWRGTATGFELVDIELGNETGSLIVADVTGDDASDLVIRYIVPATFGTSNQTIEYYVLENLMR